MALLLKYFDIIGLCNFNVTWFLTEQGKGFKIHLPGVVSVGNTKFSEINYKTRLHTVHPRRVLHPPTHTHTHPSTQESLRCDWYCATSGGGKVGKVTVQWHGARGTGLWWRGKLYTAGKWIAAQLIVIAVTRIRANCYSSDQDSYHCPRVTYPML